MGSWPPHPDMAHAVLGATAALFAAAFFRGRSLRRRLMERLGELDGELNRARSAPRVWEYRLERYDVLWFATVAAARAAREIVSTSPGVPHCRKCVLALAGVEGKSEWRCPGCQEIHPGTLSDLAVIDTVIALALELFRENHKDYRLPAKSL